MRHDQVVAFDAAGHELFRIGEHGSDPMGSLGHLKLRDFGGLIHDPTGYNRAPIDTHYHDVGVNRIDIPYAQSRGLGSVGRYEHFQGAHERARGIVQSRLGLEIPHGEFMAYGVHPPEMSDFNEQPQ